MPQWLKYENIEPDYFQALNVHLSAATYTNNNDAEVKEFKRKFYDAYGTIPDDDAYNGYDLTLFTGRMLKKYGLAFPEKLPKEQAMTLHGKYQFSKVFSKGGGSEGSGAYDYLENKFVHILKFENFIFSPVTN